MFTRRTMVIILTIIILFSGVQIVHAVETPSSGAIILEEIMGYLHHYHLDKPEVKKLVDGAIKGIIEVLDDPYTDYFSPEKLDDFERVMDSKLFGIGVELMPVGKYTIVTRVFPFSPAEEAGIMVGDVIVEVNGQDLGDLELTEIVKKIQGPIDTTVEITVERAGKGPINFELVRNDINIPTVNYNILKNNTGYIGISSFGSKTNVEFRKALNHLLAQGAKSLVIDLRDNGGGYFQSAVDIASCFLSPGSQVAVSMHAGNNTNTFVTSGEPLALGMNLAIVVNENTASASEVLAGALYEHGVAALVGTKTFGKSLVQVMIPLETGGALKITTHKLYLPSGLSLQGKGIVPNREVTIPGLQTISAYQVASGSEPQVEFDLEQKVVSVNGLKINYPFDPINQSAELYLPLRFTLEALGYNVKSKDGGIINIKGHGSKIDIKPGTGEKQVFMKNGISYICTGLLKKLGFDIKDNRSKIIICSNSQKGI